MTITLTREATVPDTLYNRHVWWLRVTATSATDDPKIFVYHVATRHHAPGTAVFECVASVPQMSSLPPDAASETPDEQGNVVPYYRSELLEFACGSAQEAQELWDAIQEDVADLIRNMNSQAALETSEIVTL